MPAGPAGCDFGAHAVPPCPTDPSHTYVDVLGFTYRLCRVHYRALVEGLQKAERFRPRDAKRRWSRRQRILAPDGQ